MRVKPAITFLHRVSNPTLLTSVGAILTCMTGNSFYPDPSPSLAEIAGSLSDFRAAFNAAAGGGKVLTAARNEPRKALVALVRNLAWYVQANCQGSLSILRSSGFPVQKPERQPVGKLPAPTNLTLSLGAHSGELDAQADPLPGAAIYNWRLAAATAPTVVLHTAQSTGASTTFGGLSSGTVYVAEVNAVATAGPTDWTRSAPQMVV
jgi:hypothetical protein